VILCEVLKDMTEGALHAELDDLRYKYFWLTDRGLVQKARIKGDADYQYLNYLLIPEEKIPKYLAGFTLFSA
jgi:hypothetical protein